MTFIDNVIAAPQVQLFFVLGICAGAGCALSRYEKKNEMLVYVPLILLLPFPLAMTGFNIASLLVVVIYRGIGVFGFPFGWIAGGLIGFLLSLFLGRQRKN